MSNGCGLWGKPRRAAAAKKPLGSFLTVGRAEGALMADCRKVVEPPRVAARERAKAEVEQDESMTGSERPGSRDELVVETKLALAEKGASPPPQALAVSHEVLVRKGGAAAAAQQLAEV